MVYNPSYTRDMIVHQSMEEVNIKFACTPGEARGDTIIDYSTEEGMEFWRDSTEALDGKKFDCTAYNLRSFLFHLELHDSICGWEYSILVVPVDATNLTGDTLMFVKNHYMFTIDHLRKVTEHYVGTLTRAGQDSEQQFACLMNSLSVSGRKKVMKKKGDYTINGQGVGILLLKVIIDTSIADITGYALREKLRNIHRYLVKVDFDIIIMNTRVYSLLWLLHFKGEEPEDLVWHLLRAYRTVRDLELYIAGIQDAYEEGTRDLTPEQLMLLAENKFRIREAEGDWCTRS